jgi:hypothetical protein
MTQVTISLDSGAFLTDEDEKGHVYCEIGYFDPKIVVYNDLGMIKEIKLDLSKSGQLIEARHIRASGREADEGIHLSDALVKDLLRIHTLYDEKLRAPDTRDFDCIFRFNSGHFRTSMVKTRQFKEIDPQTGAPTGKRKSIGPIVNNLIISYDLEQGDALKLINNGKEIWSSANERIITHQFSIEVVAGQHTAEKFFVKSVKPENRSAYWVPKQGAPPPFLSGGTHGAGGGLNDLSDTGEPDDIKKP